MNAGASSAPSAWPSGISLLADWANEQDHWIWALVAQVVEVRRRLSDGQLDELYDLTDTFPDTFQTPSRVNHFAMKIAGITIWRVTLVSGADHVTAFLDKSWGVFKSSRASRRESPIRHCSAESQRRAVATNER